MSDTVFEKTDTVAPEVQLSQMIMGQLVSRLVHLTATLKLPDYLAEGPKTAGELAQLTGTHAPSLYRVLRTLSSLGLFTEDAAQRFSLQPLGEVLKSGTPSHAVVLMMAGELVSRSLDHLLHSVRTGETGFQKAFGTPVFDWLAAHPAEASLFNQAMVGFHGMEPAGRGRRGVRLLGFPGHRRRGRLYWKYVDHDPRAVCQGARHPVRSAACSARCAGTHSAARINRSHPDRKR